MEFGNILGIWALAVLIPFIIIYLIKPKPKELTVPSLMFLVREHNILKQNAFLRKLLRNLLFFLQFAALAALALAVAVPFITIPYSVASDNTVIIIDVSASMKTKIGRETRFQKALDTAKNNLAGRVTIIAAENMPITLLKEGNFIEAQAVLSRLKPKATTTNLGDALLLAEDILKEKKGRILVISDFLQTEGSYVIVVKRELIARGNTVDFVDLSSEAQNIGIIDVEITKQNTRVFVKNFNKKEESVNVELVKDNTVKATHTLQLLPNSLDSFAFETQSEISEVRLKVTDDLLVDNVLYMSAPSKKKNNVLLITNKDRSSLMAALEASPDVALSVSHPPLSYMVNGRQVKFNDFDVVILADVGREEEKEGLLRGTLNDVQDYTKAGGKLIVAAQNDLAAVPSTDTSKKIFGDLLPVNIKTLANKTRVCFKVFNQFTAQFQEYSCPFVAESYLIAD